MNMFSGFDSADPASFGAHLHSSRCAIQLEGWNSNATKSNASLTEVIQELDRLMKGALTIGLVTQAGYDSFRSSWFDEKGE